jgi:quercetin dioxygenase-like cupin family protein
MLEGKMKYKFGSERYLLEAGDAFTFSGEVEHGPDEISSDKVVFISITYHDL